MPKIFRYFFGLLIIATIISCRLPFPSIASPTPVLGNPNTPGSSKTTLPSKNPDDPSLTPTTPRGSATVLPRSIDFSQVVLVPADLPSGVTKINPEQLSKFGIPIDDAASIFTTPYPELKMQSNSIYGNLTNPFAISVYYSMILYPLSPEKFSQFDRDIKDPSQIKMNAGQSPVPISGFPQIADASVAYSLNAQFKGEVAVIRRQQVVEMVAIVYFSPQAPANLANLARIIDTRVQEALKK
ncbi:MAG TPA: hypothetical protein VIO61_13430 [Anaerolineaceae bacterium]